MIKEDHKELKTGLAADALVCSSLLELHQRRLNLSVNPPKRLQLSEALRNHVQEFKYSDSYQSIS